MSLLIAQGLKGPFQHKLFSDSIYVQHTKPADGYKAHIHVREPGEGPLHVRRQKNEIILSHSASCALTAPQGCGEQLRSSNCCREARAGGGE